MTYQKVNLATGEIDGPAGLPAALKGLGNETLADLSAVLNPCPPEFDGYGYLPIATAGDVPVGKVSEGLTVTMGDDGPVYVHTLRDKTPEELEADHTALFGEINAERERRLDAGSSFTVAGVVDPIPLTGREFDRTVYLALLMRAQGYKAAGVTAAVLTIRSGDDATHLLTPDQMISLTTQSMTWFEAVMAVSWAMKDGGSPFEAGIPDDFTDDAYWP